MGACGSSSAHAEPAPSAPRRAPTAGGGNGATGGSGRREPRPRSARSRRNAGGSFASLIVGWDKEYPAQTAAQLERARTEFWETRVQGRPECWQALRLVAESLEGGEEETAAAILESSGMTPLDAEGNHTAISYDSLGFQYRVPLYCFYKPSNLLPDAPPPSASKPSLQPGQALQVQPAPARPSSASAQHSDDAAALAAASGGKLISFKVRFSNGLPDLPLEQPSTLSLGALKAVLRSKHPTLQTEGMRLFYLGKLMASDQWQLGEIGMRKDMVLQAFFPGTPARA